MRDLSEAQAEMQRRRTDGLLLVLQENQRAAFVSGSIWQRLSLAERERVVRALLTVLAPPTGNYSLAVFDADSKERLAGPVALQR